MPGLVRDDTHDNDKGDEDGDYEIEAIEAERIRKYGKGKRTEFFVRWKGWPLGEWIPERDMDNARKFIDEFRAKEKSKNRAPVTKNPVAFKGKRGRGRPRKS